MAQAAALWTDLSTPGQAYRVASPRPGGCAGSHPAASSPLGALSCPWQGVEGRVHWESPQERRVPWVPFPPSCKSHRALTLVTRWGQPSDHQRPCEFSLSPLLSGVGRGVSQVVGPVLPLPSAPKQGWVSPVLASVPVLLSVSSSTLFVLNCGSGL